MNEYLFLVFFNVIMIYLSFIFDNKIVILYTVLFIILIIYFMKLKISLNDMNIIEGNFPDEIFKIMNKKYDNNNNKTLPLRKINKLLTLMLDKLSDGTSDTKCEGKFVINKLTSKKCGDGFNERVYNITKKGDDCLHTDKYKEQVPLELCEFEEECFSDLDCKSRKCTNNLCMYEGIVCNASNIVNCNRDLCLKLNEGLEKELYTFTDGKCKENPCNENTFIMCEESECNDLGFKYKYNKGLSVCEKIVKDDDESGLDMDSSEYKLRQLENTEVELCKHHDGMKSCAVGGSLSDPKARYYCDDGYSNSGLSDSSDPPVSVDKYGPNSDEWIKLDCHNNEHLLDITHKCSTDYSNINMTECTPECSTVYTQNFFNKCVVNYEEIVKSRYTAVVGTNNEMYAILSRLNDQCIQTREEEKWSAEEDVIRDSPGTNKQCQKCPNDQYSKQGQSCQSCPEGTETYGEGRTECTKSCQSYEDRLNTVCNDAINPNCISGACIQILLDGIDSTLSEKCPEYKEKYNNLYAACNVGGAVAIASTSNTCNDYLTNITKDCADGVTGGFPTECSDICSTRVQEWTKSENEICSEDDLNRLKDINPGSYLSGLKIVCNPTTDAPVTPCDVYISDVHKDCSGDTSDDYGIPTVCPRSNTTCTSTLGESWPDSCSVDYITSLDTNHIGRGGAAVYVDTLHGLCNDTSISGLVPYLKANEPTPVSEPEIDVDCDRKFREIADNMNEVCCSIPENCILGDGPVLCSPECAEIWTPFAEECPNKVATLQRSSDLGLEDLSRVCGGDTTYCEKQFTKLEEGPCSISSLCRAAEWECSRDTGIPTTCPQGGCADLWNLYSDTCSDYIKTDLSELVDFTKECQSTRCAYTFSEVWAGLNEVCADMPECNPACAAQWNPFVESCGGIDHVGTTMGMDSDFYGMKNLVTFNEKCSETAVATAAPPDSHGAVPEWHPDSAVDFQVAHTEPSSSELGQPAIDSAAGAAIDAAYGGAGTGSFTYREDENGNGNWD